MILKRVKCNDCNNVCITKASIVICTECSDNYYTCVSCKTIGHEKECVFDGDFTPFCVNCK
jgi:hypothetical protein